MGGSEGHVQDERLCRDVHPAEILLPDGRLLRDLRVFVTTHRLCAWQRQGAYDVGRVLDLPLAEPFSVEANRGTLGASLEVQTAEGTVHLNRGYGCGCGSPLLALSWKAAG